MAHLTKSQRDQLDALRKTNLNQSEIADIVGCSQSTVSRELCRNSSLATKRYSANVAERRAQYRRKQSYDSRLRWYDDVLLRLYVDAEIRDGKSPDQIAGRIRYEGWNHTVSHQSIYTYIERDKERGGDLHTFLRYQGKKYKWRGMGVEKTRIPNRRDISERPQVVDTKERSGDWESDLVVSCRSGSGAVATFAERTCLYFKAILIKNQSANEMVRATKDALGHLPNDLRRTMTHDNGKEICKHEEIAEELNITVYCARPYRSCDRGLNEWYNRELRRFFPKGTDFSQITQAEVDVAVEWLNNCPRRSLGYRTPNEIFAEKLGIMHFTL